MKTIKFEELRKIGHLKVCNDLHIDLDYDCWSDMPRVLITCDYISYGLHGDVNEAVEDHTHYELKPKQLEKLIAHLQKCLKLSKTRRVE